ncbi:MAG TPA: extensin family protein [Pseudolabrys sp.]|nr:extensin family protein [Pseudolabrys sp.]
MKLIIALLALLAAGCGLARADGVPLPHPRPTTDQAVVPAVPRSSADAIAGADSKSTARTDAPTLCDQRLARMAEFKLLPQRIGPGPCGGVDMIALHSVLLPDGGRVAIEPEATLNCRMAESFTAWLRDAVAPAVANMGAVLRGMENYDSYECRSRNRVKGAKLSEHARGNAIDVRALILGDGRHLQLTDAAVDKPLRIALRDSACRRFTTVLGPGDPLHAGHIHLDEITRHNGYRICQWDVREPASMVAKTDVPFPPPRPPEAGSAGSLRDGRSL